MANLFRTLLLLSSLLIGGCVVLPINMETVHDPALQQIHAAMDRTIIAALNDPDEEWTSGWLGNMWVNFQEGKQRGLCYQWKYRIHSGVHDTVHAVGWELTGIVVNQGAKGEHHGVVVYDPARISEAALLGAGRDRPVYVLDAWRQGQADIYHLADWLLLPRETRVAAKLIEVKQPG